MEKINKYRKILEEIIKEHAKIAMTTDTIKAELIFAREQDHYQLAYVGWLEDKRVFGPVMHFDIIEGKIWIQYNGTEDHIAERLVNMGVPKEDIVLGFHSPFKRQFTDYAVG